MSRNDYYPILPPGPYLFDVLECSALKHTAHGLNMYHLTLRPYKFYRPFVLMPCVDSPHARWVWDTACAQFEEIPLLVGSTFLLVVRTDVYNGFERNRIAPPFLAEMVSP